jgi:protein SCO1/2
MLAAFVFLFACHRSIPETTTLPYYTSADFTPQWFGKNSNAINSIPRIAPFKLANQNGDTITEKNFAGKIYVADFIFTSCGGICPNMTSNMRKVQETFKNDDNVLLLSHSVTPELDSVAVLKTYAELNGLISGKWHLVTGARKMIYDLARHSYFADEDLGRQRDENEFLHTEKFFLVDQDGRLRGVYNGVLPAEIDRLIEDITLLKEQSLQEKQKFSTQRKQSLQS